jgi:UDP-N-acetylglucosamine 2-epimerase (non-hydrolysing)
MSAIFFEQLQLQPPDVNLNVSTGTQVEQIAETMIRFESVLHKNKPDIVLVYGDVNSTLATSLVCSRNGVKLAHVEAGLRSFDRSMPEEVNRIITDQLSDYLFIPSAEAVQNLADEGIKHKDIYFVGNVMIDTLVHFLDVIQERKVNLPFNEYALCTIHRASNVDNVETLKTLVKLLNEISIKIPLVFPVHPRTKKQLKQLPEVTLDENRILLTEPMGYFDFLSTVYHSKFVMTDSGGIQEETSYLNIPCLTLRENTERPVTITQGTNVVIGNNYSLLNKTIDDILNGSFKQVGVIEKWDGKAGERIANILFNL